MIAARPQCKTKCCHELDIHLVPGSHSLTDHPAVWCQRPRIRDQPGHVLIRHLVLAALNNAGLQVLEAIGLGKFGPV